MKMCDSSSDSESNDETLSDIRDAATNNANYVLPEKSRKSYDKIYHDFMNWKISNNRQSFNEDVLLDYFVQLSDKYKSSTLSTQLSMLKYTLSENHDVDISKYCKLTALVKSKAEGYTGKKSKTFSPKDINKFLTQAHDYDYLAAKVALIFGIVGGCRRQELYQLQFEDVELLGSRILIKVKTAKTKVDRIFTLTGDYYKLCKKYMSLRPDNCSVTTFFIHYKAGKCIPQSFGINKLGKLGKTIAGFLGLANPELYTGHCFKRTSDTILVDADGDILPLRKHVRYKTTHTETESVNFLKNKSIEDINKTSAKDFSNNIEPPQEQCPNFLQNNAYINVAPIPLRESIDSMASKEVWNEMKISFSESDDVANTPSTSVIEDYFDPRDSEDQRKQNENPLEDINKVLNINIPTSNTLQHDLSTLVRFDGCSIQNVTMNNYNK